MNKSAACKKPDRRSVGPAVDWPAVFARHGRWLRTVVAARLGEPQAVEEVVQEVALAAVAQQAPLSDPAKVAPWLYRLAVRQALLYRRRQGRRRKLIDRYLRSRAWREGPAASVDPLEWLIGRERREQVRRAVAELPARDREILMLKYGDGLSYRELCERLGISHSAVEARLHRARGRLRQLLSTFSVIESKP